MSEVEVRTLEYYARLVCDVDARAQGACEESDEASTATELQDARTRKRIGSSSSKVTSQDLRVEKGNTMSEYVIILRG